MGLLSTKQKPRKSLLKRQSIISKSFCTYNKLQYYETLLSLTIIIDFSVRYCPSYYSLSMDMTKCELRMQNNNKSPTSFQVWMASICSNHRNSHYIEIESLTNKLVYKYFWWLFSLFYLPPWRCGLRGGLLVRISHKN